MITEWIGLLPNASTAQNILDTDKTAHYARKSRCRYPYWRAFARNETIRKPMHVGG